MTYEEFDTLSRELGTFDNLNLSGGEPFIRPEVGDICLLFTENNRVKRIYIPTNGYCTVRTEKQLRRVFQSKTVKSFVCEISLDGMPEYHDRFRGNPRSFAKHTTEVIGLSPSMLRAHGCTDDTVIEVVEWLFKPSKTIQRMGQRSFS